MKDEGMRVLVCGGRDYSDRRTVYEKLDSIHADVPFTRLICGGALGADMLAADWARMRQVPLEVFNADWERYGRRAGPIRNQQMLDEGKPELVIAFPGGPGTADMVQRAMKADLAVYKMGAQTAA